MPDIYPGLIKALETIPENYQVISFFLHPKDCFTLLGKTPCHLGRPNDGITPVNGTVAYKLIGIRLWEDARVSPGTLEYDFVEVRPILPYPKVPEYWEGPPKKGSEVVQLYTQETDA